MTFFAGALDKTLSDKITEGVKPIYKVIYIEDVKEAVKELREKMYCDGFPDLNHKIMVDKLLKEIFGDELI